MDWPFWPPNKQRELSGCNICFLSAEAASPNPRNNVSTEKHTSQRLTFDSKTKMVLTHFIGFIIFQVWSHWKSTPVPGLRRTGIFYSHPHMGSEPKETQGMLRARAQLLGAELGLPLFSEIPQRWVKGLPPPPPLCFKMCFSGGKV